MSVRRCSKRGASAGTSEVPVVYRRPFDRGVPGGTNYIVIVQISHPFLPGPTLQYDDEGVPLRLLLDRARAHGRRGARG